MWYALNEEVDYNTLKDYDFLLCELVDEKFGFKSSTNFIKNVKKVNENIKVITYPLLVFNIFPFHLTHFGWIKNEVINELKNTKTYNNEIINDYNKDLIKFNPLQNFNKSLNKLILKEQFCDIKLSDFIKAILVKNYF